MLRKGKMLDRPGGVEAFVILLVPSMLNYALIKMELFTDKPGMRRKDKVEWRKRSYEQKLEEDTE